MATDLRPRWARQPLRQGEYDVPVMFRITAESQHAANARMAALIAGGSVLDGNGRESIVPMYVNDAGAPE